MIKFITISGWGHSASYFDPLKDVFQEFGTVDNIPAEELAFELLQQKNATKKLSEITADQEVILVAWSLGAMLALELLSKNNSISKAMLLAPSARFIAEPQATEGIKLAELEQLRFALKAYGAKGVLPFLRKVAHPQRVKAVDVETKLALIEAIGIDRLLPGLDYLEKMNLTGMLANINQPLLLMHGANDLIIPSSQIDVIKQGVSGACRAVIIANAGHDLLQDAWTEVSSLLREFINS